MDINVLGCKYYKIYFFLRNISKDILQQIKAFMQAKPAIAYLDETIGGADLEIELYIKDTEELYALIEEFRNKFSDYVKGFEFLEYVKEHTMKYLP
ncbi:MAG: hypothetical protein QME12_00680 [Nanoarchaeota archaeon]|nr:hypothetical protein [Nanoarchaeota archaeon]